MRGGIDQQTQTYGAVSNAHPSQLVVEYVSMHKKSPYTLDDGKPPSNLAFRVTETSNIEVTSVAFHF